MPSFEWWEWAFGAFAGYALWDGLKWAWRRGRGRLEYWRLRRSFRRAVKAEETEGPVVVWRHVHTGPGPFHPECPVCNPTLWRHTHG